MCNKACKKLIEVYDQIKEHFLHEENIRAY